MLWLSAVLLVVGLVLVPTAASAQPLDFSDAKEQLFTWPFDVIDYTVEDDGMNVYQVTRVRESPSEIYDAMRDMKADKVDIGGFSIVGATRQADGTFVFPLAQGNLKYIVVVAPDGAGSKLRVKSNPIAMRTGYYKTAVYEYRLGDGLAVHCEKFDNSDE